MAADSTTPRSRRAILAAAAGAAGALAAQAAMPLAAAAASTNMLTEVDNPTIATTSVTDSGADSTAFASHATGTGFGYGLEATSTGGAGLVAWSISPMDGFLPEWASYTGVLGSAPSHPDETLWAVGVQGLSPDIGVYGSGGYGVIGDGYIGVEGDTNGEAGSVGVWAWAPPDADATARALKVTGKVSFDRSGRKLMAAGTASRVIYLSGVTTGSKVFAVLATNEPGRWVRAVYPTSGRFTVYLNTKLSTSAVVAWFVLD